MYQGNCNRTSIKVYNNFYEKKHARKTPVYYKTTSYITVTFNQLIVVLQLPNSTNGIKGNI